MAWGIGPSGASILHFVGREEEFHETYLDFCEHVHAHGDSRWLSWRVFDGLAQDATPVASDALEAPFSAGGESDAWTPVLVSVVDDRLPRCAGSDGQYHVVYDLMLTNTGSEPATIDAITVIDAVDGTKIQTFSGDDLVTGEIIRHLNRAPAEDAILRRR